MILAQPPKFLRRIYKDLLWKIDGSDKTLYLTFDDGPTPKYTDAALDLLNEYHAKASFFCLGKNAVKYPLLFKRIKEEEHQIGNHSYSHPNGWKTNPAHYAEDINKAAEIIDSKLFRPPYGKLKSSQIKRLKDKYTIVMWTILTRDYDEKVSKEKSLEITLNRLEPGAIIVLHDSIKAGDKMLYVLENVLKKGRELGYQFKALPNQ